MGKANSNTLPIPFDWSFVKLWSGCKLKYVGSIDKRSFSSTITENYDIFHEYQDNVAWNVNRKKFAKDAYYNSLMLGI